MHDPDHSRTPALAIRAFLQSLGIDTERGGLVETPKRVERAFRFWLSGYEQNPDQILKTFDDGGERYDELVFEGGIPIYSLCEHHLATFFGVAHIAYIPSNSKIVGLSKLARLAEMYARRLQTQERLTRQIAEALHHTLKPIGVGVVLRCRHLCLESRGVQKPGSITMTSAVLGALKEKPEARAEFLKLVDIADRHSGKI